jgi:hypothetical protein
MPAINFHSKLCYRPMVSFIAEKGIESAKRNKSVSEWIRNKSIEIMEKLLFEGEWEDAGDIEVEMTVIQFLRSSALSQLSGKSTLERSKLNRLINFLKI